MREIVFYTTPSGRSPVREFLLSLSAKQRGKVAWVLKVVRSAHPVPVEYLKKLPGTEGLWEIRVTYRGDAFRLLCFLDGPNVVVLLTGFAKKTNVTPLLEIQVARQRRRDYLGRKEPDGR